MTDLPPSGPNRNLPVAMSQGDGAPTLFVGGGRHTAQAAAETDSVPWARYIDALKRYWWIVVIVMGMGAVVGQYLKKQAQVEYTTDATILITTTRTNAPQRGPILAQPLLTSSSWQDLVKQYSIIEPVVRRLSLNVEFSAADAALANTFTLDSTFQAGRYRLTVDSTGALYTLAMQEGGVIGRGTVGDSIGHDLGFNWAPTSALLTPRRVVDFSVSSLRAKARSLRGKINADIPGQDGQFMILRLSGDDPRRITATLNAWVEEFINTATEMKKGSLTGVLKVMSEQLGTVDSQLNAAQEALQRFQEMNATELPSTQSSTGSPYYQIRSSRDAARDDRTLLEDIAQKVRNGTATEQDYLTVPAVINGWPLLNPAIQRLGAAEGLLVRNQGLFASNSPDVQTARANRDALKRDTIPAMVNNIVALLRSRERDYTAKLDTMKTELIAIPGRVFQEQRLRRDFTQREQLYSSLKVEYDRNRLADQQTTADLKVQELAQEPTGPSSNPGPRLFLMAVVGSIGAGIALALLRDRLDRHFRHPEQATMELGLTIVGTVPKFRTNRKGELNVAAMSQVVESFRALRLSVRHHFPHDQPAVFCVSSPGTGEGKSLVSSNLAIAFANSGHKTLLIDGDVRRGVVHTTFDMQRRPGLIDFLGGSAKKEAVIRATATENLSVITSGARSRRAPELLVSDHMAALVAELRNRFDVVIIDAAPFAAGMDAYALGAAAGSMLVVLRAGVTDRNLAAMRLEILDRLPVGIIGAVVNGISGSGAYRYYYSDYAEYAISEVDEDMEFDDKAATPKLLGPL
jgi:capsular exopolysaccharide synthesis family protein